MALSWLLYEFVINLIDGYFMFAFLKLFFKESANEGKRIFIVILLHGIVVQGVNMLTGVASIPGIALIFLFNLLIYRIVFDVEILKLTLAILVVYIIMCSFEFLGIILVTTSFKITTIMIARFTTYRIITAVSVRMFYCIAFILVKSRKINHKHIKRAYLYELIIIFLINMLFIFMIFSIYKDENILYERESLVIIGTISIMIFSILIIKIADTIFKYSSKEAQWILKETEYKNQIKYINNMQEFNKKLRAQRHDFNHHMGCVYGLLDNENIAAAKEYMAELVEDIKKVNNIVNVDNPVIGALLNYKLSAAEDKNINLKLDINIPEYIGIDPVDICIVLGNALDNAIEACSNINNKQIVLKMSMMTDHLIIKISNSMSGHRTINNNQYLSTKDDKDNHGFGLQNIRFVVDKYDGLLKIDEDQEWFTLNIALLNNL